MNERIKLIAKQAGGYVSLTHGHEDKFMLLGEDNVQKFAELIIRECAEVCRLKYAKSDAMSREMALSFSNDVKQHFGVTK